MKCFFYWGKSVFTYKDETETAIINLLSSMVPKNSFCFYFSFSHKCKGHITHTQKEKK